MAEFDFTKSTKTAPTDKEEEFSFGGGTKEVEEQKDGTLKTIGDVAVSGIQGIGKGITYLMDLPQAISDAGDFAYDQTLGRINLREMRLRTDEERQKAQQLRQQTTMRIEPGKAIRENVLRYQPQTTAGRYAQTMGEYAAPGGLLGKGAKAKALLTGTGLIGGGVEEGTRDLTGNDLLSVGAGVGTNIALDIFALSRGNPAAIAKNLLPNENIQQKAQRIQKYGQERGINLTTGEATDVPKIFSTEASLSTTEKGSKIFDDFYQTRPEQVKVFAKNMANELGFTTKGLDTATVLQKQKKVAALLKDQRTKLWERSGGLKFKETYFDQSKVDNIVAEIERLKTKNPSIADDLEKYANDIRTSGAKGGDLHAVYREIRDIVGNIAKNPNKTVQLENQQRVFGNIEKQLDGLLSTNDDYLKAQKKYKQFTNAYIEPYNRTQIFKDIKVAGFENNPKTVGRIYRFLNDIQTTPRDIEKLANAYKATGNNKAWQEIVSAYFEDGFMKSIADSSANPNFGKAISDYFFKSPRHRENFTEMVYQMAKQRGGKVVKKDIKNSVDSMFQVFKAASKKPGVGSPTAQRGEFFTELEKNKIAQAIGGRQGIPLTPLFIEFFNKRTLSKNSQLLSEALTSEKGIDALIDLAQNYKDPAQVGAYLRSLSTLLREE
tara:strand:+ start:393 stop:2378 length:1986 start_codon:yes stop_codon:yes gene_type:complete